MIGQVSTSTFPYLLIGIKLSKYENRLVYELSSFTLLFSCEVRYTMADSEIKIGRYLCTTDAVRKMQLDKNLLIENSKIKISPAQDPSYFSIQL